MRNWTIFMVGLTIGWGGVGPRPAVAQTVPVRVALTGTAAPTGGNYTISAAGFGNPVVNGTGQVAFTADLTGGTATRGVFTGAPGAVQTVALTGLGTPGPAGSYNGFGNPVLNGTGTVAFDANGLFGGSSTQGMFMGTPGAVQTVALNNTAAPVGGNYTSIGNPLLNGTGQVAFNASLSIANSGIFVGVPGAVQTVAVQGTVAPGGGNYSGFSVPVLSGAGQVAYRAGLTGGTSTEGIFRGTSTAVQTIALKGTAAPTGGNYGNFGDPAVNGTGQVAFLSNLTVANAGIFTGTPTAVQAVAVSGTPAPAGGDYINFGNPVLNGTGQLAFRADLTGGTSPAGIFAGTPGAIQAVALQGTAAPAGGNYDIFNQPPSVNGAGHVAFTATLTGAGVTAANNYALYVGSAGGVVKVVRSGDQVDVDPGIGIDLRTVRDSGIDFGDNTLQSGGQDGRSIAFSDNGFLVYTLRFTDNSSGVFVSQFAPVPEPATVGLSAAVGLAVAGWLGRRGGRWKHIGLPS